MNIILLISDTFRYDNLFDRAAMPVSTPNLDAFADRAVSLERMYTGSFPTIPHRTDVTTGRIGWPWYPWQSRLASSRNHLPQILSRAGYVTQLICDCPHLFRADFDNGFDGALVIRGQEGDKPLLKMNYPIRNVMPRSKTRTGRGFQGHNLPNISHWTNRDWRDEAEEDRFPPRTARLAGQWLEENFKWHPFFLWVDFFDPHEPWDPPEHMVRKYDPRYAGCPMIHPNYGKAGDYTKAELRNLRAHYCAEAQMVDRWVGRILQKIDDLDLWKNSIVVFTSDHGMYLGEHNRTGKSNINDRDQRCWPIYPEIAHVPFMIAAPPLAGGRKISQITQPADILPTLLDLAAVKAKTPEPMHGKSFAPLLRGRGTKAIHEFAVTAGCLRGTGPKKPRRKATTPVLYTKKWAYAPFGPTGRPELFDLAADPYAEKNIAAEHPGTVKSLHAKLVNWLRELDAPPATTALFER